MPTAMAGQGSPRIGAAAMTQRALAALWRPASASWIAERASWLPHGPEERAVDLQGVQGRPSEMTQEVQVQAGAQRPHTGWPWPVAGERADRRFVTIGEGDRDDPPRPVSEPAGDRRGSRVRDVDDERRRLAARIGHHRPQPALEGIEHGRLIGEDVGMVPLGVQEHGDRRSVGVEVACVLVRLDDAHVAPTETSGGRRLAGWAPRHERTDEAARVAAGGDQHVEQPAGRGRLAVGAGDADELLARGPRRIGHELLPRFEGDAMGPSGGELRMVRRDGGERLGDGQAVDDRTRPRGHMRRIMGGFDPDPAGLQRGGVGGRCAGVARRDHGPDASRQERGRRGAGAGGPNDVDALPGSDGAGGTRRRQAGADLGCAAGHPSARGRRASSRSSAAPALASLLACRSPVQW